MKKLTLILAGSSLLGACAGSPEAPQSDAGASSPPPVEKSYLAEEPFQILSDRVTQGEDKSAIAVSARKIVSTYYKGDRIWELKADLSSLPKLSAPGFPLLEALYNLSLEEALANILQGGENAGAFMAGKQWTGVWTRDISYSIHLALASVFPQNAMASLKAKVNAKMEIIQDTGTGGSWPISTDRVVWSIAAWEVYKVTGDKNWLSYAYTVLKNSALRDREAAFDASTGLYFGESSFMDWREQSYPKWMTPTDIYESRSLSTNVLHHQIRVILAAMAKENGAAAAEAETWSRQAAELAAAIDKSLWLADSGFHSSYMYPALSGNSLTEKPDSLGQALGTVLGTFDKSKAAQGIARLPVVHYGVPCFYPQMGHADYYHNKAIWPFVTAYYTWAGVKTGNPAAAEHGLRSLYRAAALFLTNKENMTYDTGHWKGPAVNSDRQLWSVAGLLSTVYRLFFGMEFTPQGLAFKPWVSDLVPGDLTLSGFAYRKAVLDITVKGRGSQVVSLLVNGQEKGAGFVLSSEAAGPQTIVITVEPAAGAASASAINLVKANATGPKDAVNPKIEVKDAHVQLSWRPASGAAKYRIFKNGRFLTETADKTFTEPAGAALASYSVQSVGADGVLANQSEYLLAFETVPQVYQAEEGRLSGAVVESKEAGFSGKGYVNLVSEQPQSVQWTIEVPQAGRYALRWRYSNGNGPINTENKAALRSVEVNGKKAGKLVLPQTNTWNAWGRSNALVLDLPQGASELKVYRGNDDDNMNLQVNQAYLDALEVIKLP